MELVDVFFVTGLFGFTTVIVLSRLDKIHDEIKKLNERK